MGNVGANVRNVGRQHMSADHPLFMLDFGFGYHATTRARKLKFSISNKNKFGNGSRARAGWPVCLVLVRAHSACRSWRYWCSTLLNRLGNLSMSGTFLVKLLLLSNNCFNWFVYILSLLLSANPTNGFVFADKSTIQFPESLCSVESKRFFKRIVRESAPWGTTILHISVCEPSPPRILSQNKNILSQW